MSQRKDKIATKIQTQHSGNWEREGRGLEVITEVTGMLRFRSRERNKKQKETKEKLKRKKSRKKRKKKIGRGRRTIAPIFSVSVAGRVRDGGRRWWTVPVHIRDRLNLPWTLTGECVASRCIYVPLRIVVVSVTRSPGCWWNPELGRRRRGEVRGEAREEEYKSRGWREKERREIQDGRRKEEGRAWKR